MNPPAREIWEISDATTSAQAIGFLLCSCSTTFSLSLFLCVCLCGVGVCGLLYPTTKNSFDCRWFHCGCGCIHFLFSQGQFGQPMVLTPLKQAVTANPPPSLNNPRQSWANPKLIPGHSQLGVSHRAMPGQHGHSKLLDPIVIWNNLDTCQIGVP